MKKIKTFKVKDVFSTEDYAGNEDITWEYDLGASWEHSVKFVRREERQPEGAGAGPSGGPVVCLSTKGCPMAEDGGRGRGKRDIEEVN